MKPKTELDRWEEARAGCNSGQGSIILYVPTGQDEHIRRAEMFYIEEMDTVVKQAEQRGIEKAVDWVKEHGYALGGDKDMLTISIKELEKLKKEKR